MLLVRWSWRDLRARWVQVGVLALVVALGTGTYAALLSTSAWRRASNAASFALLHVHDVRVAVAGGSSVPEGSLLALLDTIPAAGKVRGARERLIVPTQVAGPRDLLVPGEVVGTGGGPGAPVDSVAVEAGHGLAPGGGAAPGGRSEVVLDAGFARQNDLAVSGSLRVAGGATVHYVGLGQAPEQLVAAGAPGGTPILSQRTYAAMFTDLATAQRLADAPGRVNDLVVTLDPGASSAAVAGELRSALARAVPPVSATVTTRDQIPAYRLLYDDIASDEQLFRAVALLVLAGAAFAALNLTGRVVEAERREIGIGMALGVRPAVLAVRPLLFAAELSLIGAVLGVAVGFVVGIPVRNVFEHLLPLPVWRTPFQAATFGEAAVIGFVLPFAAAAWPVWRAVRVEPVEAIRPGHGSASGGGLAGALRHLHLPGPGYREVPLRNVARRARRSVLTLAGVAATVATLVTVVGLRDTYAATLDRASAELLQEAPNRVTVALDRPYPVASPVVAAVRGLPEAGRLQAGLQLSGTVRAASAGRGAPSIGVVVTVLPPSALWMPSLLAGRLAGGLVLSEKAASELGVGVGGHVLFRHPQAARTGLLTVDSTVRVAGIDATPLRPLAYVDEQTAGPLFQMTGRTNLLTVVPSASSSVAGLQRALLDVAHVASATSVASTTAAVRASLGQFTGMLNVATAVVVLLILLISFNTAAIGTDEQAREHATMLAFGLPVSTVLAMGALESLLVGGLGAVVGVAAGYGILSGLVTTTIAGVTPELGIVASLSAGTVAMAIALGVGAVTAAPLLTAGRLRRLDLPSRLRLVE